MTAVWICLVVVGVLGIWFFNRLVRFKNLLNEAFSGIDVQLKRRHDLVPSIVEAVKGYGRHERGTLEEVTRLRSQLECPVPMKDRSGMETDLSRAMKSLFALGESYPDLKADKNFLSLQNNLIEIEDQIQYARRYYNGTVRNYNVEVQSFPSSVIAGLFHFKQADFFEIEYVTERKTPDVKFDG